MKEDTLRFASELDALLHGDRHATDNTAHLVDEAGSALNAKIRKMKQLEVVMDECDTIETRLVQRLRPAVPLHSPAAAQVSNPDPLGRDIGPMPRVITRTIPTGQTPPPTQSAPDFNNQEFTDAPRRAAFGF